MAAAEAALRLAAAQLAADIVGRFTTAEHLSPEDRAATLTVATQALLPFQPASASPSKPDAPTAAKPGGAKAELPGAAKPRPSAAA